MKKFLKGLILTLFLFPFFLISGVHANEQINLFKSDIVLEKNTDINIREEIHYFFPTPRRGIIREIPTKYKVKGGLQRPTLLKVNEIYYYSENNPKLRYSDYEITYKSGYIVIKVGNPDSTITGEYVYIIDYKLRNAVNYFEDHDELFLNITGNGWSVPIIGAYATIEVPGDITDRICFTGTSSSTESECSFEGISKRKVKLSTNSLLNSFEGYTVALKMPKGTLDDIRGKQRVAFILSNLGLLLPIPTFVFLISLLEKKGKNKKRTVIAHYEPIKDINPLLAGYIYKKVLNNKHITAEIIQMAIDGHIKIVQEEKKQYVLEKQSLDDEMLKDYSNSLLLGLFKNGNSINTKKIPSDFYLTVRSVEGRLNSEVYDSKVFSKTRKNLKTNLVLFGFLGFILSLMSIGPLSQYAATGWSYGFAISSLLATIFSSRVDVRGKKGNEIYYELEGLKLYINTAEKHRIEFHNDPEKYKGIFEQLLPYAIIFGLERKWANEFKDIYKEPPSWYEGDISTFNAYTLANSVSNIEQNIQNRTRAANSAGGFSSSHGGSGGSGFSGGSSGGGFGGGGGSSW